MPPLRERKSDMLLLADHFLEKFAREHGQRIKRISTTAIDMLASYHWPGNVRELENIIERAGPVCETGVIHRHQLPPALQTLDPGLVPWYFTPIATPCKRLFTTIVLSAILLS